jgi:hypothetical protein
MRLEVDGQRPITDPFSMFPFLNKSHQCVKGIIERLRHNTCLAEDREKISVPYPSGDNMEMKVTHNPGTGTPSDIGPHI